MEAQFTISSIVFIVLLIVPGVFFKRFYFQGQFAKQFGAGLFADRIITSIFWGIFVQIVTFLIFSRSLGISYNSVKKPISNAYDSLARNAIPEFTVQNLWYSLSYLLASIFIAAILGTFFHKLVRILKLDIKFQVFRFANQWNYYFRGDILHTTDFKNGRRGKVLSTLVDVVIDNADGKNKMFSGFLTQYTVSSRTGELETIYLTEAQRYSESLSEFKLIPGDCLSIPYNRVVNLNLRYNIKSFDGDKKRQNIKDVISIFGYLGFLFIILYPWFLDKGIFITLTGILLGFIAWTTLIAITNSLLDEEKDKLKGLALVISIIIAVFFGSISLYLLGLY